MTSVPDRPVSIYALIDPRTDAVRYVGQTVRPEKRWREHCAARSHTHRDRWIRTLRTAGLLPAMRVIETTTAAEAESRERHWIAAHRAAGANLTNLTDGGRGPLGMSEETRRAIGVKCGMALKGRSVDPAVKARISATMKARGAGHATDATRETLREKGRRDWQAGSHTEHGEKMRAFWRDNPEKREEVLAKMRTAAARTPRTQEAKARQRAASKANWQDPVYVAKVKASRAATRERKKIGDTP